MASSLPWCPDPASLYRQILNTSKTVSRNFHSGHAPVLRRSACGFLEEPTEHEPDQALWQVPDLGSLLSFAGKALPTLGTALVAWLGGRYGRKVRVKVGEVEVEANTVADIKDLLSRVEQMQKVDKSLPPSPEEHSR